MPTSRPTGLRDFTPQLTDIAVKDAWTPPTVATSGGVRGLKWGMLGNDVWGDCYWASAGHEFMAIRHRVGASPEFTDEGILNAYGDYQGTDGLAGLEANRKLDVGTDAREGAKFRRDTGIADATDHQHYIHAYAFETDPRALPALIDATGGVTVCVELTQGCEQAFGEAEQENKDFIWDDAASPVAGGHAIAGTFWTPDGIGVISWGREGVITWDYLEKKMQTTVVYFSRAQLDGSGETPEGLDRTKLLELISDVRGQ